MYGSSKDINVELPDESIPISSLLFVEYGNEEHLSVANFNGLITIYKVSLDSYSYPTTEKIDCRRINCISSFKEPILSQCFFNGFLFIGSACGGIYCISHSDLKNSSNINVHLLGKHEIGVIYLTPIPTFKAVLSAAWDGFLNFWTLEPQNQNNFLLHSIDTERKILTVGKLYL